METARIAQILDEMGTLLEVNGREPVPLPGLSQRRPGAASICPDDLSEMIADGRLAEVPGIGETMLREDRRSWRRPGSSRPTRSCGKATPPGPGRPAAGPRARAEEDQGAARRPQDREPGRPPRGGRVGADRRAQGVRRQDRGEDPRRDRASSRQSGDRIFQSHAERLVAPDPRGRPRPSRGDPGRGLRQPPPPGRDDRRPRHPVQLEDSGPGLDAFVKLPEVATVLAHGPTKASVRLADGVQCDLRGVDDDQFPFALHYFTGSKAHNIAMRRGRWRAGSRSTSTRSRGEDRIGPLPDRGRPLRGPRPGRDPARASRGRRRDRGRREGTAAPSSVERDDLTGTFHCHTDWSDGAATLAEMAEAARDRGLAVPGDRRPLAVGRLRGRADHRAGPRAVGRDRRPQRSVRRQVPPLQGDRVRHPRRRLARLSPTTCSTGSTTSWRASIRSFGMPREEMTRRIVRAVVATRG